MRIISLAAALLVLGTGCSKGGNIWAIYLEPGEINGGSQTISHNFTGAVEYDNGPIEGDWTFTSTETGSPTLLFAQVVAAKGDNDGYLIFDDIAIPGVKTKEGWTFTWSDDSQSTQREEHVDGYFSAENDTDSTTTTLDMVVDGKTATGAFVADFSTTTRWEESDTWNNDELFVGSNIPVSNYLETADGGFLSNSSEEAECDADCFLEVTTTGSRTQMFTAELTDYNDDAAMIYMGNVTSP